MFLESKGLWCTDEYRGDGYSWQNFELVKSLHQLYLELFTDSMAIDIVINIITKGVVIIYGVVEGG